jgi:hypothetical protein
VLTFELPPPAGFGDELGAGKAVWFVELAG